MTTWIRSLSVAVCVAVVVLAARSARAEESVLVVTDGGTWDMIARANAERTVGRSGYAVIRTSELVGSGLSLTAIVACAKAGNCSEAEMQGVAHRLLVLTVEHEPADPTQLTVTGWLLDGDMGNAIRTERRVCSGCGMGDDTAATVAELAKTLLDWEHAPPAAETMLVVTSEPGGAEVFMNGAAVGKSGEPIAAAEGTVTITCTKPGYATTTLEVSVVANQTTHVTVALDRAALVDDSKRLWSYAAGGAGIAALGLGVAWIAMDGPRFDGDGNRLKNRRESLVPGIVATGVGAALITSGVMLWWRSGKESALSGTVAPTSGGAVAGIAGVF